MSSSLSALFSLHRLAGNRRLFLFCALLFVVSAFLSFWLFFPAEVLQRRLVQDLAQHSGLGLRGEHAAMRFPPALEFDLYVYPEIQALADLKVDNLRVSPVWNSLLTDSPAVDLKGGIADGAFTAVVGRKGQLDLNTRHIALLPLQEAQNTYRLAGFLQGHFQGEGLTAEMNGQGRFTVEISEAQVLGLQKIGLPHKLDIGLLQAEGKFSQRRVSLEKVVATEGALELSGGGTLLVGETAETTRLNLNFRLHPNQSTPESLRDLIKLSGVRPTADGSYLLRVGGTLAKPVIR